MKRPRHVQRLFFCVQHCCEDQAKCVSKRWHIAGASKTALATWSHMIDREVQQRSRWNTSTPFTSSCSGLPSCLHANRDPGMSNTKNVGMWSTNPRTGYSALFSCSLIRTIAIHLLCCSNQARIKNTYQKVHSRSSTRCKHMRVAGFFRTFRTSCSIPPARSLSRPTNDQKPRSTVAIQDTNHIFVSVRKSQQVTHTNLSPICTYQNTSTIPLSHIRTKVPKTHPLMKSLSLKR